MEPGSAREHRSFEEMAVAHVLGGLDQERGRLFRAHLLECSDCRARVGELRAIAHDLADVERDERRERAARTVDTKRRDDDEDTPRADASSRLPRILLILGIGALLSLSVWTFMLRGQITALEAALEDRVDASAALELGDELPTIYSAPGITGTAKRSDRGVVVLLEGVTPERMVGVYVLAGSGEELRAVFSQPYQPDSDKLLVLLPLSGSERFVRVTVPAAGFTNRPDGTLLFEARLDGDD